MLGLPGFRETEACRLAELACGRAAGESAAGSSGPTSFSAAGGDFYTAEEMAQFVKPKKRRLKKKLRKKESEEGEAAAMAVEIAALEAAATAAGAGDHGSRAGRGAEKAQLEAQQRLADLQARQERYGPTFCLLLGRQHPQEGSLAAVGKPSVSDCNLCSSSLAAALNVGRRVWISGCSPSCSSAAAMQV